MFTARLRAITNKADWSTAIQINDKATGTPVDLTGDSFSLALRLRQGNSGQNAWPNSASYYDWSASAPDLTGSTATGEITNPSVGILQVYFPVGRIQSLRPGTYDLGLTVTNGVFTMQVAIGTLPIVDGFVA